jgi:hypothetical protein
VLVRVLGAREAPQPLELDTDLVVALRAAVHDDNGPEVHLVLDLASAEVRAESRVEGERVLLRLTNG